MDDLQPHPTSVPAETPLAEPVSDTPAYGAIEPLTLGGIFSKGCRIYAAHWTVFVGVAAAVLLPFTLLQSLFAALEGSDSVAVGSISLIENLFVLILQGAIVKLVADHYLGRPVRVGEALALVRKRAGDLLTTNLLAGLLLVGAAVIPGGLAVVAFAADSVLAGALLLIPTMVMLVIGSFWITFVNQVVVIEGLSGWPAIQRSRELAAGQWGRIFSLGLMLAMLAILYAIPVVGLGHLPDALAAPAVPLANGLMQILFVPLSWTMTVLLYYDIRVRKEGFGLDALAKSLVTFG